MSLKIVSVVLVGVGVGVAGATMAASAPQRQAGPPPVVKPGAPGKPSTVLPAGEAPNLPVPKASAADITFMQGMIVHHAQAVEMVALLKTRTNSKDMQQLGHRIDVSQTDEIRMMRRWLEAHGAAAPDPMSHDHMAMGMGMMPGMLTPEQMTTLAGAKGAAFDRLFLKGMIQHHGGALVMVKDLFDAPGAAQDADIFDFASHVDADQRMEIVRMSQMLRAMQ